MNIKNKVRGAVLGALVAAFAAQSHVASAAVFCKTFWPKAITQCASSLNGTIQDSATGSGSNLSTANPNRRVTVNWITGTVRAQAGALNSQGGAISGCSITDTSKGDGSRTVDCFTADPPVFFFMTAD